MIDFSSIPRASFLGRLLRWPLSWVPNDAVVRVLQGELRGAKWIVGSSVHGCWLGNYELEKQRALLRYLRAGMVMYDVGANVGFYSLLAARVVGRAGTVHAFEPLPSNCAYLRRHIVMNGATNVLVHPMAISDEEGERQFVVGSSSAVGRLGDGGTLSVRTASIDALVADGLEPPNVIKMDIEGGEAAALRGALRTLERHRPIVLVATHGPEVHLETIATLEGAGYAVTEFDGGSPVTDELLARPPQQGT